MNTNNSTKDECVGSLIVYKEDVQELSSVPLPEQCSKDECVGSLIVHQSDVQELSEAPPSNLVRRVTERVADAIEHVEVIDPDDDVLNWQCDV